MNLILQDCAIFIGIVLLIDRALEMLLTDAINLVTFVNNLKLECLTSGENLNFVLKHEFTVF